MDTKGLDAANAYAAALEQMSGDSSGASSGIGKTSGLAGAGSAFADMVTEGVGDLQATSAKMEATSAAAVSGKADIVDVVTAVSDAELMVSTVVNVRDKVISAYQQVLKMPI